MILSLPLNPLTNCNECTSNLLLIGVTVCQPKLFFFIWFPPVLHNECTNVCFLCGLGEFQFLWIIFDTLFSCPFLRRSRKQSAPTKHVKRLIFILSTKSKFS